MLFSRVLLLGASVLVLSACGANRYCVIDQPYQSAATVPELKPVEGLSLPQSPSALRLPAAPAERVPFGTLDADGMGVCLDKPPILVKPPEKEEAPVAAS